MQKSFCDHCGGLLELGFEEVQAAMQDENLREAQAAFTRRLFFWLATMAAVLVGPWPSAWGTWKRTCPGSTRRRSSRSWTWSGLPPSRRPRSRP